MDWKKYEEITKYIYETLGQSNGVKIECFGNECKLKGKSEVFHQIDVYATHSDGLHTYKTLVECKYWNDNINKDIIMKVAEIVEDTGASKGVIVSKNGFTPDAVAFAKYKNIGLIELREPTEKDWEGRIKDIHFEMNMLVPRVERFEILVPEGTTPNFKTGRQAVEYLQIKQTDGSIENIHKWITDFTNELCKKEKNEKLEKTYIFDGKATLIYSPTNQETEITGLKIAGTLGVITETFEIKGEDHVYMIMKSIFEEKSFSISKTGEIREQKETKD